MNKAQAYVTVQFILFGMMLVAMALLPTQDLGLGRWVGVFFMAVAVAFLGLSVQAHNRINNRPPNITPTPHSQSELVSVGIYGYVRHPIYTAVMSGILGAWLTHGNMALGALWAVFVVFFTFKALYEETLLKAQYADYSTYMMHTGRFLPFL